LNRFGRIFPYRKNYQFSERPDDAVRLTDVLDRLSKHEVGEYYVALYFMYRSIYFEQAGFLKELEGEFIDIYNFYVDSSLGLQLKKVD
jgi:hypothetical protein